MNRSTSTLLINPEVFWPRTSKAVFGFSFSLGSRFLRKRLAFADLAVLESTTISLGHDRTEDYSVPSVWVLRGQIFHTEYNPAGLG